MAYSKPRRWLLGLGALALLFFVLFVLFVPAHAHARVLVANAGLRPDWCTAQCGTNQSINQPYYQTPQFWANLGDGIIVSGIVGILLTATVYRHLILGVASVFILIAGIVIAVVL